MSFDLLSSINQKISGTNASDLQRPSGGTTNSPTGDSPAFSLVNSFESAPDLANTDLFFRFTAINQTDFKKSYGYELWIRDSVSNTTVAKYFFPINPSNITYSNPVAKVLEATMKGSYETHNGAPFRPISVSGTTGIAPKLATQSVQSANAPGDLARSVEYAFKNTISAVNTVVNQALKVASAFTGGTQKFTGPLNYTNDDITKLLTGYQTINDLDRFLDYYVAGKKLQANRGWRLYFINNKDKKYHACSLDNWTINKAAGTLEYAYNINMTAYRREPTLPGLSRSPNNLASKINASATSNTLSNIINGINQARTLVAASNNVLSGIRNDINDSFIAPIGQIVLLGKDLVGLAQNMYDFAFSGQTLSAMKQDFLQYFTDNKNTPAMQQVAATVSSVGTVGLVGGVTSTGKPVSSLNSSAQNKLTSGMAEQFQSTGDTADPTQVLFENPANYPQVFASFPIDSMNLSQSMTNQLNGIVATTRQFTANDLITMRGKVQDFATSVSSALGGGSATYNTLKGLPPPPVNFTKLTVQSVILLNQINDILIYMDKFIAMMDLNETNANQDYYQFYADYAVTQGLRFNSGNLSRFFVPFPMNSTLEQLATQYLGAPERWIEVAALNGLKQPYVDETGYQIPVTASPGSNTLFVAQKNYLYVGQVVNVASSTQTSTKQQIIGIDVQSESQVLLTFSPSSTPLTNYQPADGAYIQAFMPDTVNSGMLIAIPSTSPPKFNTNFKLSPEVAELQAIARMAKVDILLDQSGDWSITGGGDVNLAVGYTNLIQAALIKLNTLLGSLLQLPGFGNPVDAGISTADINAADVLASISNAFQQDPRFGGLVAGQVTIQGPSVSVMILVKIADTDITLPVATQLPM